MKHHIPKHASHGTEHHDFISFVTLLLLILGLLVLLYLLYFCRLPDREHAPLARFASAREQAGEDNEISGAALLSRNQNYRISLSPYSHRYFYIVYQRNCSLQILSGSSSIQVACYSQKGRRLNVPKESQQYHFGKISETTISPGDRLFLKFANTSTKPSTIKVKYCKIPAKKTAKKNTATPKPKKAVTSRKSLENKKAKKADKRTQTANTTAQTTSKPPQTANSAAQATPKPSQTANSTAQTTSKPSQTADSAAQATSKPSQTANSAAQTERKGAQPSKVSIKPHFLRLTAGSKKKFSLSLGKSSLTLADCTYFLTDTSVLSIQGNILTAEKAGIAILYVRTKKTSTCGSCLIRVTDK